MFTLRLTSRAAAACLAVAPFSWQAFAQSATTSSAANSAAPSTAASPAPSAQQLAPVVITGNPLGRTEALQPSTVLTGQALSLRREGTLGDTLDGLPGVSTSSFGPQAGRPVIRGLDGDRIRLLDNGGAVTDASNLSFDHAVAIDPLVIERVEVLRGPAALLYGGNATGGVVNTLDNRVPRTSIADLGGRVEARLGGAANERAGAAVLEGGQALSTGSLNWHLDLAGRDSQDLRVPTFTPIVDGVAQPPTHRVANSAGTSKAGAVGASWSDAQGFVGVAHDGAFNRYGVAVEPDVTIRLRRERTVLMGERRGLAGPISQVEFQVARTRYRHEEVEGTGEVGTTFASVGRDWRVQARHKAVDLATGRLQGVVGLQGELLDFSALGEEAFVPSTRTRSTGLFVLEEARFGGTTVSAGARWDRTRIASAGDEPGAAAPRFGTADERRFAPRSLSLGLSQALAPGWTASASVGSTQRAPTYYELFANGVHVATGAFEVGDANLGTERSRNVELGLQWRSGEHTVKAQAYQTRFGHYIALDATGNTVTVDGEDVPEYRFSGVRAKLTGFELEGRTRAHLGGWGVDLQAGVDAVRGTNTDTGESLPRLAPMRVALGADASRGAWRFGSKVRHAMAQSRVPSTDVRTGSWTMVDLWAGWATRWAASDALWFLKVTNVGNVLAYNASAVRTAREVAPMAGRGVTAGVRVAF